MGPGWLTVGAYLDRIDKRHQQDQPGFAVKDQENVY